MGRLKVRMLAAATCVALIAAAATQQVASGPAVSVSSVLADVKAAYAAIDVFDGTGWARSEITDLDGVTHPLLFEERDFHAVFTEPDQFCFSMVHLGSRDFEPWTYTLAIEGTHVTPVGAGEAEDGPTAIRGALSGSAAFTSGAASLLVGLLLPAADSGYRLADLRDAQVAGEDIVGDDPCLRIVGRFRQRSYTYWVSRTDHTVRRFASDYSSERGLCRNTIEFVRIGVRPSGSEQMHELLRGVPPK